MSSSSAVLSSLVVSISPTSSHSGRLWIAVSGTAVAGVDRPAG